MTRLADDWSLLLYQVVYHQEGRTLIPAVLS
jgi:hypothetical protein